MHRSKVVPSLFALAAITSIAIGDETTRIPVVHSLKVQPPAIIAVLPPVEDTSFWDAEGAAEHEYHVANALDIAAECLAPKEISVALEYADVINVDSGESALELNARKDTPWGAGAYLLAPGLAPRLVACELGTSPLQVILPIIAAKHFGHPECVPEEWRDIEVGDKC